MKSIRLISGLIALIFFSASCGTSQKTTSENAAASATEAKTEAPKPAPEPKEKPAPEWAPVQAGYHPSETRVNDLIHTSLSVSFDWKNQYLLGKAFLTLKPYFYPTDSLTLDAKGFDIKRVAVTTRDEIKDLKYTYDGMFLRIKLDRTYTRNDQYKILVDYVAKPNELEAGGSAAITSDKGLYFINPLNEEPNKPQQIWTQGETEASSAWFPTIDSPNERTTQEIWITVDDRFVTLSNGILLKQEKNSDGTRTDYWKQDLPHAPYLFMMAIGEFAVVKDSWTKSTGEKIEVNYYVEPEYEQYAKLIFGNTPEMLTFYSNVLGVEYPWDKYSQVVVRDFVSGAMENTGAVIHFDALQHTAREHLDATYEDIIAHELFHHWFGDMVTTESWPNLPLNESFATYGEYLWNEYKYGKDAADHHGYSDLSTYLVESGTKREPLIRYYVENREDMFDAHSYQKGGRVLHMLRNVVGDEAFFESLKYYLTENAYSAVEIAELRMAFEDVSGMDLNWFFDQWFMKPGHPELAVKYEYSASDEMMYVSVRQQQDLNYMPVYRIPTEIDVFYNGAHHLVPVTLHTQDTVFALPVPAQPDYAVFDAKQVILGTVSESGKKKAEWLSQLKHAQNYMQKYTALKKLTPSIDDDAVSNAFFTMTQDTFWAVRNQALRALEVYFGSQKDRVVDIAAKMAVEDPKSQVRASALGVLQSSDVASSLESSDAVERMKAQKQFDQIMEVLNIALKDSSYLVQSEALRVLHVFNNEKGLEEAKKLRDSESEEVIMAVADIMMTERAPETFDYMRSKINSLQGGFGKFQLIDSFGMYLLTVNEEKRQEGLEILMDIAENDAVWWIRLSAGRRLLSFYSNPEVKQFIDTRLEEEPNETVRNFYKQQMGM